MKIKQKTQLIGLILPLTALTILTVISWHYLKSLAHNAIDANEEIGVQAAQTSEHALLRFSNELNLNMVNNRAAFIEQRFRQLRNSLQTIQIFAENFFTHSEIHKGNPANATPKKLPEGAIVVHTAAEADAELAQTEHNEKLRELDEILHKISRWVPNCNIAYTSGLHGTFRAAPGPGCPYQVSNKNYDPRKRPFYQHSARFSVKPPQGLPNDGFLMESLYRSANDIGKLIITATIPLFGAPDPTGNRRFAGVAAIDIDIRKMGAEMLNLPQSAGSTWFIIDNERKIILRSYAKKQSTGLSLPELPWYEGFDLDDRVKALQPFFDDIDHKRKVSQKLVNINGINYQIAIAKLPTPGWEMLVFVPEDVILQAPREITKKLQENSRQSRQKLDNAMRENLIKYIIVALLSLTVMSILALRISRKLVKAIQDLSTGVSRIGKGDFTAVLKIDSRDELQTLAGDINRMTAQLDEYTHRLVIAKRWEGEMNAASEIQMNMLPQVFPPFPEHKEFSLFAQMTPAREIGGDFYDFFLIGEDKICVLVGDVSGKGIPAALFMAVGKTLIKNYILENSSLNEAISKFNQVISSENTSNYFMTLFVAVLNYRTGEVEFVDAGHNPPMFTPDAASPFTALGGRDTKNPAIGMADDFPFRSGKTQMDAGGRLLIYTDGVTEAENTKAEHFGEDALIHELNDNSDLDDMRLVKTLHERLLCFAAGQPAADDVTMLILSRK